MVGQSLQTFTCVDQAPVAMVFMMPWPMLSAGCRNVQDSGDVWGAGEPGDGSMSELW